MSVADNIRSAAKDLAETIRQQMTLEKDRHTIKVAAIDRIIKSGDNPMTGKPHSFSSAEAQVHADAEYDAHLSKIIDSTVAKILAVGNYDAAVAEAEIGRSMKNAT
jgi:hypothetical protein